jgi:hypothetical protein
MEPLHPESPKSPSEAEECLQEKAQHCEGAREAGGTTTHPSTGKGELQSPETEAGGVTAGAGAVAEI